MFVFNTGNPHAEAFREFFDNSWMDSIKNALPGELYDFDSAQTLNEAKHIAKYSLSYPNENRCIVTITRYFFKSGVTSRVTVTPVEKLPEHGGQDLYLTDLSEIWQTDDQQMIFKSHYGMNIVLDNQGTCALYSNDYPLRKNMGSLLQKTRNNDTDETWIDEVGTRFHGYEFNKPSATSSVELCNAWNRFDNGYLMLHVARDFLTKDRYFRVGATIIEDNSRRNDNFFWISATNLSIYEKGIVLSNNQMGGIPEFVLDFKDNEFMFRSDSSWAPPQFPVPIGRR